MFPNSNCSCGHGDAGCSKCGLCSICIQAQENDSDGRDSKQDSHRLRSKSLIVRRKDKKAHAEENNAVAQLEIEKEPPRVAPLPPQMINLPTSSPVVQIACGLHHTVVMTLSGEVFTFGSNQYGQLGTGDLQSVQGPVKVNVPGVSQVSCGSNHTVLMTYKGMVYTFGNYQKGQLGRLPQDVSKTTDEQTAAAGDLKDATILGLMSQRQKFLWHCTPAPVL